jgi:ATP-dependent RNA helicase DeaD
MTQENTQEITFETFGLKEPILQALQEAGFKIPTPIQKMAIPLVLSGQDIVGQAHTGTGKTAAFGLPALHLISEQPNAQLLVLTPTRELASQVSDEIYRLGRHLGIRTATICGGKSFKNQIDAAKRGTQVIVATPGRLLDLFESGSLSDFQPTIIVLDEADEMLDMGFLEAIQKIFTFLPKQRQTLLFSATMPAPIQRLASSILKKPQFISVTQKETTNKDIEQVYYVIREDERDDAIVRLLDTDQPNKSIIFCRTKKDVDRLSSVLVACGYQARGLHGDMEQPQREEVIRQFRSDLVRVLVATDVAARGLSVSDVSHVFNYHLPFDPASYVHRIGRTGRAGNKGMASTFVTLREWRDFQRYEKFIGTSIARAFVPSLEEARKSKRERLVGSVLAQPLHKEAELILQLITDLDHQTLASKFISFVLHQQSVRGPEFIGVDPKSASREPSTNNRAYTDRRRTNEGRYPSKSNSAPYAKKPYQSSGSGSYSSGPYSGPYKEKPKEFSNSSKPKSFSSRPRVDR